MKKRLKTLMKLAIWASVLMYLVNKFIESDATIRHMLKISPNGFFDWNHGKIYYTKQGSGSPILLVHDLHPASSQYEWSEVISKLAKTHTVYAIDLLGCGRSDKPCITYTNYLFAQLLRDFTEEIIGEPTEVYATGKSCAFAVTAAKMAPESFTKITLVNPESLKKQAIIPDQQSKVLKTILDLPLLGVTLYYMLNRREQLEYDFAEKYFYNPFHFTTKTIQTYYEAGHLSAGGGRHLQASIVGNYVNFDIAFALSTIKVPVAMIFGSELDNAKNIAASYQKLLPGITCSYVAKTKMLPQMEAPEQFLACM